MEHCRSTSVIAYDLAYCPIMRVTLYAFCRNALRNRIYDGDDRQAARKFGYGTRDLQSIKLLSLNVIRPAFLIEGACEITAVCLASIPAAIFLLVERTADSQYPTPPVRARIEC